LENITDKYEDRLGTYLVKISSNNLSHNDSHAVGRLLHSIGDYERISDHALNICKLAEEMHAKGISFSENAQHELSVVASAINEIVDLTVSSFKTNSAAIAAHVEPLEQVIDGLSDNLKAMHIKRLQANECTIELGFIFTDLLTNFERVSDHCSNVAVYTMQLSSDKLDAHKYLNSIKSTENDAFMDEFNTYKTKYSI
jgi:phosphate:Na+ symporter